MKKVRKILFVSIMSVLICSCGVTSARISKPSQGTTTTVTITTNNPITTEVSPDVKFQNSK